MESFIITLTFKGSPVIFRFVSQPDYGNHTYEVSALNSNSFTPFLMEQQGQYWRITSPVSDEIQGLELKLSALIAAYMEGRG